MLFSAEEQRVVLVALFHTDDKFRNIEQELPPGLSLSRSLRNLTIEIKINEDLAGLYEASLPFEHFEDKVFGPQEVNLQNFVQYFLPVFIFLISSK